MTDPAAARSGAAPQPQEIADLIRKLRLDASGENGRISADDLYRAADVLAALAAARLAQQQELADTEVRANVYRRGEEALAAQLSKEARRADAAEAARTALRQQLQALPRYEMSNGFVREWYVKASDLAERLAREEHPKAADA